MRTIISLLVAFSLLAVYAMFVAFAPEPRQKIFQSQDQLNKHVIERFRVDAGSRAVIYVGSSMTARLAPIIDQHCIYNLALTGDSSLTGLRLLTNSSITPKVVYIETNVPQRAANIRLIQQAEAWLPINWNVLDTENRPVNRMLSYLRQLRPVSPTGVNPTQLKLGLEVQQANYEQLIPLKLLEQQLVEIQKQIWALQKKHIEVVLFEMPTHPTLMNMPQALQIREAFRVLFPDLIYLTPEMVSGGKSIQTVDGVHLSMEEAPHIAAALANHHASTCTAVQTSVLH